MVHPISGKMVAAALSVVVAGGFGVGISGLAKGDAAGFSPDGLASAYAKGSSDYDKGFRASLSEVDAQANRHDDKSQEQNKTTNNQTIEDAFSQLPLEGKSGSSVYQVSDSAQGGTVVSNNNTGADSGENANSGSGSNSDSNAVVGPVIPGNDKPSSGDNNGTNTDNNGGSNSGNNGGDSGNNGGSSWVNPYPEDAPIKDDSKGILLINDSITSNVDLATVSDVTIVPAINYTNAFYVGQSLNPWAIFCSLDTSFHCGGQEFEWYCATQEEFEDYQKKYFQIVSYPEKITESTFSVTVRYRFSTSGVGSEWQECVIDCYADESLLLCPAFNTGEIGLTPAGYDRVLTNNGVYSFYQRMDKVLAAADAFKDDIWTGEKSSELSKLCTGWKVDGKKIGYTYNLTPGRHVAEVGEFVNLPDYYTAECSLYWLDNNCRQDPDGRNLSYLQTLTGVEAGSDAFSLTNTGDTILSVPYGIDAINIVKSPYGWSPDVETDYIQIPSSVIVVDYNSDGLNVDKGYLVDKDNQIYSSTIDGILTSKDKTEYLGVPLNKTDLVVPDSVKKVSLSTNNNLEHLVLQAKSIEDLPEIDFSTLNNCNIVINDELFDSFIDENYYLLVGSEMSLSRASNPLVKYKVEQGTIYSDNELVKAFDVGNTTIKLEKPHVIKTGSFEGCSVDTLILSDGSYIFEDDCFKDGNISLIVCSTQEQVNYVMSRLEAAGAPDAQVALSTTTAEGYTYYQVSANGITTTTLLEAPEGIELFERSFVSDEGNTIEPDVIAPKAFANCQDLRWVTLGEQTRSIGASAFEGCQSLQGVFVSNPEYVSIESDAFANCPSMQFVASRAMQVSQVTADEPNANCVMYCPTGSSGYYSPFTYFTEDSNINDYDIIRQSNGSLILCGSYVYGEDRDTWITLKAGSDLPEQTTLPEETRLIFTHAFTSNAVPFTLNWDDLTSLYQINSYAFYYSPISGDIRLGVFGGDSFVLDLQSEAFYYCPNITSVAIESEYASVGSLAFDSCTGITSITIDSGKELFGKSDLGPGVVSGSSSLEKITFTNPNPISLSFYNYGYGYMFDASRTQEEEEAALYLEIPIEYQEAYIKEWSYSFLGYSSYDDLHQAEYNKLVRELGYLRNPTETEIRAAMKEDLLWAENHLRIMMGAETVDTPLLMPSTEANGCTFIKIDGETVLAGVSSDAEEIDLRSLIPDSINEVKISDSAFAECTNLKRIILSDKVKGIYADAFLGCDGVEVVLLTGEDNMPELLGGSLDTPFTFGADIKLTFDSSVTGDELSALQNEYLKKWTWQSFAAVDEYFDEPLMYASDMWDSLAFKGYDWDTFLPIYDYDSITATQLNDAVNNPFMEQENSIRGFMGLETISDYHDACSFYDVSSWFSDEELDTLNKEDQAKDKDENNSSGAEQFVDKTDQKMSIESNEISSNEESEHQDSKGSFDVTEKDAEKLSSENIL